ncbi:acyl-CoA-binding domain-containing protein 4 [Linnemannia zychae]|nr:acyl-CoA-binding domain-containing protein 4 [Linnemannia zychae]
MATPWSRTNTRHRRRHLRLLPILLLTTSHLSNNNYHCVHAQTNWTPTPVSGAAFARTSTSLYILGGNPNSGNNGPPLPQFFSLNLAVSWNNTSPAWKLLPAGPAQAVFPATFSADQTKMIVFHLPAPINASRYDVDTGVWTPSRAQLPGSNFQGVGAITDTNTGLVYTTAGYVTENRDALGVYNFNSDVATQAAMPSSAVTLQARAYYGNVWSKYRKSILYFGGYTSDTRAIIGGSLVTELVTSSLKWNTLSTSGPAPSMRADHCVASNEEGTMMVVFGGRPTDPGPNGQKLPYLGDVYILNTVTLTWTQGNPGEPRIYAVCTISNNQLLVWGGSDINDGVAPSDVLIYNLTSATWIKTFSPKAITSNTTSDSTSPVSAGVIAGGVVAGVAVICACTLFYIFRRRHHTKTPVPTTSDHDTTDEDSPKPTPEPREDYEIERLRIQLKNQQEQLDLQRRLLMLQQQQQQLQAPLIQTQVTSVQQPQLYHDPSSAYQHPVYYTLAPTTQPYSGQSDLNIGYIDAAPGVPPQGFVSHLTPIPMPPIGTPSTLGDNPTDKPVVTTIAASKTNLAPSGLRHDSNYWEERPPGNPHAIINS